MNRSRLNHGFTLIELLVVVAIIIILVALILPSLSAAREQSKALVCLSNQRQIGMGMAMYSQEYNDFVPVAVVNEGASNQATWDQLLSPYVQSGVTITNGGTGSLTTTHLSQNIYRCPVDLFRRGYKGETRSYSRIRFSQRVSGSWTYDDFTKPIKLSTVAMHSNTILVLEWQDSYNILGNNWRSWSTYSYFVDATNQQGEYHRQASNFLFFDGHADRLTKIEASRFDNYWRKN